MTLRALTAVKPQAQLMQTNHPRREMLASSQLGNISAQGMQLLRTPQVALMIMQLQCFEICLTEWRMLLGPIPPMGLVASMC